MEASEMRSALLNAEDILEGAMITLSELHDIPDTDHELRRALALLTIEKIKHIWATTHPMRGHVVNTKDWELVRLHDNVLALSSKIVFELIRYAPPVMWQRVAYRKFQIFTGAIPDGT
jgi:hypothetical protein